MADSELSFGLVMTPRSGGREWLDRARTAEQQGWTSLLVPDTLWTVSPFPTLAAAAAGTSDLRLRTWVLAAPFRHPAAVVREVAALQLLSDGRFEFGIGSGRPDAEREAARLGVSWGSAAERIRQVEEVISAVRTAVRPLPPVIVAAGGPRMLAAAGRIADRVALALPPTATTDDLGTAINRLRAAAPSSLRFSLQVSGVAGRLPDWLNRSGLDAGHLAAAGAVGVLNGDAARMADTLRAHRDNLGIDEFIVPGDLAADFAPVISDLRR